MKGSITMPEVKAKGTAALLNRRLEDLKLTKSDFIRKISLECEKRKETPPARNHMFRILNGQVFAGQDGLLLKIAKSLGIDKAEILEAVQKDKIIYKGWGTSVPKASPITQETANLMDGMTKSQQTQILNFAKMLSKTS